MHASEVFYFFADDRYTSFVRCIEFEDPRFDEFGAIKFLGESEDCGGFTCARGAIEEHMGKLRGNMLRGGFRRGGNELTLED